MLHFAKYLQMMKLYCVIILLVFYSHFLEAQSIQRLRAEIQHGFIISHASDLKPVSDNRPTGFHVSWQRMGLGQNHWEICNCFYYIGAQFSWLNFGDRDILGDAYTLAGTFEPVLWRYNQWSLSLNSGIGATWLTKVHHPENNPLNNFFSSRLSFLLYVAPAIEYRFSDNWSGRLSANYNHISNGGRKQPNRGMNYPQVGIGVNYYLNNEVLPDYERQHPGNEYLFWIESGFTTRKVDDENNRKPSVALVGGVNRAVSAFNGLGFGAEYNHDFSMLNESGNYGVHLLAPFISHHFIFGKFDFSQRMSWYAVQPEQLSSHNFYQRYVITYKVFSGLRMGFSLKSHGHVATNIDFRMGWEF